MKKDRTKFYDDERENAMFCGVAAAVVGGGALLGAKVSSDAAGRASKKQAAAAQAATDATVQAGRESNQLNWAMYQQQLANQQPQLRGGQLAYSALMSGMGLGPAVNSMGGSPGATTQTIGGATPMSGGGLPAMSPGGGFATAVGAPGGVTPDYGAANQQPFTTDLPGIGEVSTKNYGATNEELAQAGAGYQGSFTKQFAPSDLTMDPSYQWRLQQGMRALESSAAARGMTGSGSNLADITNYAQGAASQEYQNAFDRYQTNQTNLFNRLSSLAGTGQVAANNMGSAADNAGYSIGSTLTNTANNVANIGMSNANSQAAASIGQANAWSGALNSIGGAYAMKNWMTGGSPGFSGTQAAAPIADRSFRP